MLVGPSLPFLGQSHGTTSGYVMVGPLPSMIRSPSKLASAEDCYWRTRQDLRGELPYDHAEKDLRVVPGHSLVTIKVSDVAEPK